MTTNISVKEIGITGRGNQYLGKEFSHIAYAKGRSR